MRGPLTDNLSSTKNTCRDTSSVHQCPRWFFFKKNQLSHGYSDCSINISAKNITRTIIFGNKREKKWIILLDSYLKTPAIYDTFTNLPY